MVEDTKDEDKKEEKEKENSFLSYGNFVSNINIPDLKKIELISIFTNLVFLISNFYNNCTVSTVININFINLNSIYSYYQSLYSYLFNINSYINQIMEICTSLIEGKKSWQELKSVVNEIRKKFSNLNNVYPSNISFRHFVDGRTRIYFLCYPPKFETTLLYVDIYPDGRQQTTQEEFPQILQWHPVLDGGSNVSSLRASRELQLLLERKRLPCWGISSYEFHKKSGKIVFSACDSLYQCLDTGFSTTPLFPTELRINQKETWTPVSPVICPKNSELVAYVCGGDIWVVHSLSGHNQRLTHVHDESKSFVNDPLSAGMPSYVMQEEFNRYQGFWWQPDSDDGFYRICFEEVDESEVTLLPHKFSGDAEEYRFPRAGTPNAKSNLKMIEFRLSEALRITDISIKELQYPLLYTFPWMEYLVRVGWTPDSSCIWAQLLNRQQQRLNLILIPIENFSCEPYNSNSSSPEHEEKHLWKSIVDRSPKPIQVIYTEYASQSWINVHDILLFLDISDKSVQFIWASEETGFRHLYLVTSSLVVKPQNGVKITHSAFFDHNYEEDHLKPRIMKKIPLTMGEWEVIGRKIWYDKKNNLVYFLSLAHSPLEKHLYVFNLFNPDHKRMLTIPGASNVVEFNEDCTICVRTHSQTNRMPTTEVISIKQMCKNGNVEGLELTTAGYLLVGQCDDSEYTPMIYSPKISSGDTIYAMVFKPHNFKLGVQYPTILNVYGGPEVQTVSNSFKGMRQLRMHMLASQGYCVICIDSRGSQHRGVQFESHIKCRLGTVELADQVEVLRVLAKQLGYIDMTRVAIHGWSYGGYLSLMGLVQYPEIFKLAIAGAPVTNWEYYDTGYTERYMDTPQNNRQGYIAGSVMTYVHKFPEEANRLLIIHGLIDENVHFYHTSQLINSLIKANKPYQLQIYPKERHSLRNLESSKHFETYLLQFLQDNL